jgi:hypothetical protein
MKERRFLAGVLLALGLVTVGCDNGTTEETKKFDGTWRNPNGNHPSYAFIMNSVTGSNDDFDLSSATFVYTDTTITFTPTSGSPWTQNYILSENVLSLDTDVSHPYGPFLKQKPGATKFEGTWKNTGAGTEPTYAFTDNRVVYSNNTGGTWEGIFAFTDSSMTFTRSLSTSWTQSYTLSGNILTIVSDSEHSYGDFQKQ